MGSGSEMAAAGMEGVGDDMDEELEDDGQSELARMQKANLGDTDLAEYAIKGGEKVRAYMRHAPLSATYLAPCRGIIV
jgi:hypothetical protein